jgi:glycosyltransferase involved in cell wall biosynthesis
MSKGTQQPLISVLVSAYNAEYFLLQTIHSVLDQTYGNIEVLILDDKSKDDTY